LADWDLEIKKRFAQPLAAESGEFPDAEVIQARMVPICYSESLSNGASAACAGFMATATEQFMKEILSNIFCRTKSNMSGGSINSVQTHRFKAQLQLEEDQYSRHEIMKVAGTGLLPVEAKEASIKSSLAMHDLKMAMDVGDILVGQFPLIASRIDLSYAEDEYEEYQTRRAENARKIGEQQKPQHDRAQWLKTHNQDVVMKDVDDMPASSITNGVNGHNDSWDDEDEDNDWGWDGGNADSREQLNASLDACLAMDT
jgi:transcriptional coactivator HFI1/ADA1